ncbi:MAG: BrnT family toxin [Nitrospira sp.]|nr:BrnT family toxin [Nitrospira sp.]
MNADVLERASVQRRANQAYLAFAAAGYLNVSLQKTKGTHFATILIMKTFAWNSEKNDLLKAERGISFEEIVLSIQLGDEVDIFEHPNQERYPGQKVAVVLVEGYAYLVPFVENDEEIFLKTIIPSRKATKQYGGGSHE